MRLDRVFLSSYITTLLQLSTANNDHVSDGNDLLLFHSFTTTFTSTHIISISLPLPFIYRPHPQTAAIRLPPSSPTVNHLKPFPPLQLLVMPTSVVSTSHPDRKA